MPFGENDTLLISGIYCRGQKMMPFHPRRLVSSFAFPYICLDCIAITRLPGGVVLGNGLRSFAHGVLGQLLWQQESCCGLNFSCGQRLLFVDLRDVDGLGLDALEEVLDEGPHDGHGTAADAETTLMQVLEEAVNESGPLGLLLEAALLVTLGNTNRARFVGLATLGARRLLSLARSLATLRWLVSSFRDGGHFDVAVLLHTEGKGRNEVDRNDKDILPTWRIGRGTLINTLGGWWKIVASAVLGNTKEVARSQLRNPTWLSKRT